MRRLLAGLAVFLLALTIGTGPAAAGGGNRNLDVYPFYGGSGILVHVSGSTYSESTGWFMLGHGGATYSADADHAGHGTFVENGNANLLWGSTAGYGWVGAPDMQLLSLAYGGTNRVWANPNANSRIVYNWETTPQDTVGGAPICMDGSISNEICGAVDIQIDVPIAVGDGTIYPHMNVSVCPGTVQCVTGGDSGGPVYGIFPSGVHVGQVEAIGMIVAYGSTVIGGVTRHTAAWAPIRNIMSVLRNNYPGINVLCSLCTNS